MFCDLFVDIGFFSTDNNVYLFFIMADRESAEYYGPLHLQSLEVILDRTIKKPPSASQQQVIYTRLDLMSTEEVLDLLLVGKVPDEDWSQEGDRKRRISSKIFQCLADFFAKKNQNFYPTLCNILRALRDFVDSADETRECLLHLTELCVTEIDDQLVLTSLEMRYIYYLIEYTKKAFKYLLNPPKNECFHYNPDEISAALRLIDVRNPRIGEMIRVFVQDAYVLVDTARLDEFHRRYGATTPDHFAAILGEEQASLLAAKRTFLDYYSPSNISAVFADLERVRRIVKGLLTVKEELASSHAKQVLVGFDLEADEKDAPQLYENVRSTGQSLEAVGKEISRKYRGSVLPVSCLRILGCAAHMNCNHFISYILEHLYLFISGLKEEDDLEFRYEYFIDYLASELKLYFQDLAIIRPSVMADQILQDRDSYQALLSVNEKFGRALELFVKDFINMLADDGLREAGFLFLGLNSVTAKPELSSKLDIKLTLEKLRLYDGKQVHELFNNILIYDADQILRLKDLYFILKICEEKNLFMAFILRYLVAFLEQNQVYDRYYYNGYENYPNYYDEALKSGVDPYKNALLDCAGDIRRGLVLRPQTEGGHMVTGESPVLDLSALISELTLNLHKELYPALPQYQITYFLEELERVIRSFLMGVYVLLDVKSQDLLKLQFVDVLRINEVTVEAVQEAVENLRIFVEGGKEGNPEIMISRVEEALAYAKLNQLDVSGLRDKFVILRGRAQRLSFKHKKDVLIAAASSALTALKLAGARENRLIDVRGFLDDGYKKIAEARKRGYANETIILLEKELLISHASVVMRELSLIKEQLEAGNRNDIDIKVEDIKKLIDLAKELMSHMSQITNFSEADIVRERYDSFHIEVTPVNIFFGEARIPVVDVIGMLDL